MSSPSSDSSTLWGGSGLGGCAVRSEVSQRSVVDLGLESRPSVGSLSSLLVFTQTHGVPAFASLCVDWKGVRLKFVCV